MKISLLCAAVAVCVVSSFAAAQAPSGGHAGQDQPQTPDASQMKSLERAKKDAEQKDKKGFETEKASINDLLKQTLAELKTNYDGERGLAQRIYDSEKSFHDRQYKAQVDFEKKLADEKLAALAAAKAKPQQERERALIALQMEQSKRKGDFVAAQEKETRGFMAQRDKQRDDYWAKRREAAEALAKKQAPPPVPGDSASPAPAPQPQSPAAPPPGQP